MKCVVVARQILNAYTLGADMNRRMLPRHRSPACVIAQVNIWHILAGAPAPSYDVAFLATQFDERTVIQHQSDNRQVGMGFMHCQ